MYSLSYIDYCYGLMDQCLRGAISSAFGHRIQLDYFPGVYNYCIYSTTAVRIIGSWLMILRRPGSVLPAGTAEMVRHRLSPLGESASALETFRRMWESAMESASLLMMRRRVLLHAVVGQQSNPDNGHLHLR